MLDGWGLLFRAHLFDLNGQFPLRIASGAHECLPTVDEDYRLAAVARNRRNLEELVILHLYALLGRKLFSMKPEGVKIEPVRKKVKLVSVAPPFISIK